MSKAQASGKQAPGDGSGGRLRDPAPGPDEPTSPPLPKTVDKLVRREGARLDEVAGTEAELAEVRAVLERLAATIDAQRCYWTEETEAGRADRARHAHWERRIGVVRTRIDRTLETVRTRAAESFATDLAPQSVLRSPLCRPRSSANLCRGIVLRLSGGALLAAGASPHAESQRQVEGERLHVLVARDRTTGLWLPLAEQQEPGLRHLLGEHDLYWRAGPPLWEARHADALEAQDRKVAPIVVSADAVHRLRTALRIAGLGGRLLGSA